MKKAGLALIIASLILFGLNVNIVFAGFGVTPSGVSNHKLLPGSHFEQTIYLVQSKPEEDLLTTVEIEGPEIKDWISIDRGFEFTIPAGNQQFPIKVIVDVPKDAEFKHYSGKMWIKTAPEDRGEGMVTVALGAMAYLDLTVSTEEVYGFVFRGISIADAEEGRPINIIITLQNVGNLEDKPTKIHLDVHDAYLTKILQSNDITKGIETIKPFETKGIEVKFPNKLALGAYFGEIKVYKDDKVIGDAKTSFHVIERTGILYKVFSKWYSWLILVVLIIIILALIWRKRIKKIIREYNIKRREKKKKKLEEKLRELEK